MNTNSLSALDQLRIYRSEIKEREALINSISDEATAEAVAILLRDNRTSGEFEHNGHKYQLQRTEVFDFADYRRYPQPEAVQWRDNARAREKEQKTVRARTAIMNGCVKTFAQLYPDKEPDEIKITVKVIE